MHHRQGEMPGGRHRVQNGQHRDGVGPARDGYQNLLSRLKQPSGTDNLRHPLMERMMRDCLETFMAHDRGMVGSELRMSASRSRTRAASTSRVI